MLRLSKLTDYGIVIMSHMAKYADRAQTASEVAVNLGIAQPTVSKILKALTRKGYLMSQRGSKGGYYLAVQANDISVTDLIDSLEGPLALTECSYQVGLCRQEDSCSIRDHWLLINQAVRYTLDGITLAQMSESVTANAFYFAADRTKMGITERGK